MRIIAGKMRGTRLISPKNANIRPTTDRVKEAMFDALQNYLPDANVMDLFCGSGALGIEAWSRGAKKVILVDNSVKSIADARANWVKIGRPDEIKLIKNNYKKSIKLFKNTDKFDIVLIDPPYKANLYKDVLYNIENSKILNKDAVIVVESGEELNFDIPNLNFLKNKNYGDTFLTYYKYNPS